MLNDLQQLIDTLPVAVCVCEAPGGVIRLYNRRATELWGRQPRAGSTAEVFCGSRRLYRLDGSPLAPAETPVAAALREGGAHREEVVMERPDGSRVVVRVNVAPLRDGAGRIVGAVNAFQDVTDERRGLQALRLSEARYRAIVEDHPELICRFLPTGR